MTRQTQQDGRQVLRCMGAFLGMSLAVVTFAPPGWAAESVLYSFRNLFDGQKPQARLIFDSAGALYGTTSQGGTIGGVAGKGTIFKLTPPVPPATNWTKTNLFTFGNTPGPNSPDYGVIFDNTGSLYGVTPLGGAANAGTVYRLNPPVPPATRWSLSVLYEFKDLFDGRNPRGELVFDSHGALNGVAYSSPDWGIVFKLTPPCGGLTQWIPTVLYTFKTSADGDFPSGRLVVDSTGALYGTTEGGGAGFAGTVFRLNPPVPPATNWTKKTIVAFNGTNGETPHGGLIADSLGALYGTTYGGGTSSSGTLFKLTPPVPPATAWKLTILFNFGGASGSGPLGGLTI